jgi:predicted ATPase
MSTNDTEPQIVCQCYKKHLKCKAIVLTGGPGAGKTAVLEMVRRELCPHIAILPEAAGIIFRGGFWRKSSISAIKAAQRAIFHVQHESEQLAQEEKEYAMALCDRGSLDSLAYWPVSKASFFKELNTTEEVELSRYSSVIHLRTPSKLSGYDHSNPLRIEDPEEAMAIDARIESAWKNHPHRHFIESTTNFMQKASIAIELIRKELPKCCLGKENQKI